MGVHRDALLFSEREGGREGAAEESVPGNSWKLKLREMGQRRRRHFMWAFLCCSDRKKKKRTTRSRLILELGKKTTTTKKTPKNNKEKLLTQFLRRVFEPFQIYSARLTSAGGLEAQSPLTKPLHRVRTCPAPLPGGPLEGDAHITQCTVHPPR